MNATARCSYIPPENPFLTTLAAWVLRQYGQNPAELTKVLILLPNRRACRALREAFLECNNGGPLLLPRMQPLGEMDEASALLLPQEEAEALPPAMPRLRRDLLLTRMVMAFTMPGVKTYSLEQAAQLARQLGSLLDDVAREDLSLAQLERLVPEELSRHWQQTLAFLEIISRQWPDVLAAEGAMDAVEHRTRMIKSIAAAWAKHPPAHPVIAAGSTGSQPATARLIKTVAHLPLGHVVLPGLDAHMPKEEWDVLAETHPQYALKQLLSTLGQERSAIPPLVPGPLQARMPVVRAVFQPPAATAGWAQATLPLGEGLAGLSLLTAPTQHDEARMIAIALREVLQTPAKTAALVTPDRALARMVAAQMRRLGVEIDDTAGMPLSHTPAGGFLQLAVEMSASAAAPADLLALLRHPLAAAGLETAECRRLSRQMEEPLLRGLRRTPGLAALADAAERKKMAEAANMLKRIAQQEARLAVLFTQNKPVPLRELLEAHLEFAQGLAQTPQEEGAARLWRGDSGEQLAAFLSTLLENAPVLERVEPRAYPGIFAFLLSAEIFRPRYGKHPRLHILSPMEARLQRFDRIILAGLNEGTWPATGTADPWMSRPMRQDFGLPATDRQIGQSAHDFAMLCASPEVILSRAEKVEGSPTIPSRWLVRLRTLVEGLDKARYESLSCEEHYRQGLALLHRPVPMPALTPPSYAPPLAARPRQLPVTAIDLWVKNPYSLYAKYVLRLRPMDELDQEPAARDYGELIHKAMELLTLKYPSGVIANIEAELLRAGEKAFEPMMDRPAIACLWWPRFTAMLPWLAQQENERRQTGITLAAELNGAWSFEVEGQSFTLTARIDRMEIKQGRALIADYKTGKPPTSKKVEEGEANQLPLQALVALGGALGMQEKPVEVAALEYWYLGGNPRKCDIQPIDTGFIEPARAILENLLRQYGADAMPYAAPEQAGDERYNDYAYLIRKAEWDPV